jgi:hypothetical protein
VIKQNNDMNHIQLMILQINVQLHQISLLILTIGQLDFQANLEYQQNGMISN